MSSRCSAVSSPSIAAGRFEPPFMTAPAVHLWRLHKWGRILARHGALRGIERDANTPPRLKLLCRYLRFGARMPKTPAYADALQAIGPAAIKLGQTLATRPDIVGEAA